MTRPHARTVGTGRLTQAHSGLNAGRMNIELNPGNLSCRPCPARSRRSPNKYTCSAFKAAGIFARCERKYPK